MTESILSLLALTLLYRIALALFFFLRLSLYRDTDISSSSEHLVSIITCYHNEEDILLETCPTLLSQDYESIEFIWVNDHSSDRTLERLQSIKDDRVSIIDHRELSIGKKKALASGIRSAQYDFILCTDADCHVTSQWASTMMCHTKYADIVLGYAPLTSGRSLISRFARYEAWYTAVQYLSFALAGIPYMGVGRNLLYHKRIYDDARGFASHEHLASGDDDLLINTTASYKNTRVCLNPKSFVSSPAKDSWNSFWKQKCRHLSTATHYKWYHQLILVSAAIAHIFGYLLAMVAMMHPMTWIYLIIFWLIMMIINYPICRKLESTDLWLLYPVYDFAMMLYYIIMFPFTLIKKETSWS